MLDRPPFEQIWAVDFEFIANPGERPIPVCLVAWELRGGRKLRLWADQLGPQPPFPTGPESLFVAYYASAELAVAAIEHNGVPIDVTGLQRLRRHWADIQGELIAAIDADYQVYDGLTFKYDRF